MEEYKSNSYRSKREAEAKNNEREKRVEKVVTGTVKTKKKSGIQKFTEEFISEDAKNVKSYVWSDVLIPAVKKLLYDIIVDSGNMILFGRSGGGNRRSTSSKISYSNYYDRNDNYRSPVRPINGYSYDDIILATRQEAEDVLARMDELIDQYQVVRVADLFDLVGKTCNYTDNKYGWTNIRSAEVRRVRDGYMIQMPRAVPID